MGISSAATDPIANRQKLMRNFGSWAVRVHAGLACFLLNVREP
jgi:hypothetical protein